MPDESSSSSVDDFKVKIEFDNEKLEALAVKRCRSKLDMKASLSNHAFEMNELPCRASKLNGNVLFYVDKSTEPIQEEKEDDQFENEIADDDCLNVSVIEHQCQ